LLGQVLAPDGPGTRKIIGIIDFSLFGFRQGYRSPSPVDWGVDFGSPSPIADPVPPIPLASEPPFHPMDPAPVPPNSQRRKSSAIRVKPSPNSLKVTLKLPPNTLAPILETYPPLRGIPHADDPPASSPILPSSPPTIASSPAPAAAGLVRRRGGPGKRARPGPAPGSGVFALNSETGGASGAGTPAPQAEKEKAKPGPKANPGGINAGLRALDRSGKPTRRWQRVQVPVRTISGYIFYTSGWATPGLSISSDVRLTTCRVGCGT